MIEWIYLHIDCKKSQKWRRVQMTTMAPKIQGKKKVYSIECPCSRKVILSRFQLSMFVQPQDRTAHEFWGAGAGGCWRREEHRWWANFVRHHHHLKATRVLRQNLTFAIIGFRQLIHCNISFDFLSFFFSKYYIIYHGWSLQFLAYHLFSFGKTCSDWICLECCLSRCYICRYQR